MRKIRAEMPSNPQQNHLGMELNASIALDVAPMTGAGCVLAAAGDRLGRIVMSAVSGRGEPITCAGNTGGPRDKIREDSARRLMLADGGGGDRCSGMAGVVSALWGSTPRIVSFVGSTMTNQITPTKIAENCFDVTR
jgi:hypothetical protein